MTTRMTPEERRRREAIVADEARFEALLEAAFRVAPVAVRPARTTRRSWPAAAAIAATVVLAAGAWLGLRTEAPPLGTSPLAPEIIAHIRHEPGALVVTARTVPRDRVDEVLRRGRASLAAPIGDVSYAKLCPFRGQTVAHFVVQGAQGPVTVMLLPDESVATAMPIDEDGFKGTIMPLEDGGSIVIVGRPDEDLEVIRDRLRQAVRWRI